MVVANNVRCCCALREIARRGNLSYTERHPAVVDAVELGGVISAADQAKVFQEFQQADNSITRKKGGTGLAISKRIIDARRKNLGRVARRTGINVLPHAPDHRRAASHAFLGASANVGS